VLSVFLYAWPWERKKTRRVLASVFRDLEVTPSCLLDLKKPLETINPGVCLLLNAMRLEHLAQKAASLLRPTASLIFKLKLKDQAPDRLCTFIRINSATFSSMGRWFTLSHLYLVKPWITCVTIVAGQLFVHSSGKLLGIFNFSQISYSIRDTDLLAYLLVPLI
jgi:hypothetical protein